MSESNLGTPDGGSTANMLESGRSSCCYWNRDWHVCCWSWCWCCCCCFGQLPIHTPTFCVPMLTQASPTPTPSLVAADKAVPVCDRASVRGARWCRVLQQKAARVGRRPPWTRYAHEIGREALKIYLYVDIPKCIPPSERSRPDKGITMKLNDFRHAEMDGQIHKHVYSEFIYITSLFPYRQTSNLSGQEDSANRSKMSDKKHGHGNSMMRSGMEWEIWGCIYRASVYMREISHV